MKTPLCVVVYPFLFGGNLCLNVLCMPPFHYPLKKHKRNHLFSPKLDTRETDRSESSNIHKDRQTPTRLYLNSLILFFFYLLPHQLSLFTGWFGFSFLFFIIINLNFTLYGESGIKSFRESSPFARNFKFGLDKYDNIKNINAVFDL